MKKYLILVLAVALLSPVLAMPGAAIAPKKNRPGGGSIPSDLAPNSAGLGQSFPATRGDGEALVSRAVKFAESVAVKSLPSGRTDPGQDASIRFREDREVENPENIREVAPDYKPSADAALQEFSSALAAEADVLPAPSRTFTGLTNDDNFALFGRRVYPPDTNGDVGPNHYLQVTNLALRVYNKRGVPLTAPVTLGSLFAPLGWPCGDRLDGDPIALYDQMADRWIVSQICAPKSGDYGPIPPYHQVIAASKTGDPTGEYFLYDFVLPGLEFNDYPHFGVWADGYYMTDNQFLFDYETYTLRSDGVGAFAFDRQKMLVGDPTASYIYFNLNRASRPEAIAGMLPADADGLNPPPEGAPCPFAYFTANEYGDVADGMRIFDFHADFIHPSRSTFIERPESAAVPRGGIPVAAFDPISGFGREDVAQPPPILPTSYLDAVTDVLMHRLQYRNFGDHESLVVNHTVDVKPTGHRYGIRYYEFRKQAGDNPYRIHEQGTYAGQVAGDTAHRWMASAAMNAAGDIAVGFSISSTQIFPSIRYAARLASDRPGGLRRGEQTIFTGTAAQHHPNSRWGDYSNLSVDPSDDCTFWYTTEVQGGRPIGPTGGPGWVTKISKFSFGNCSTPPRGALRGAVINAVTGLPIPNATVKTSNGYLRATNTTGNYSINVVPDTYTMTASAPGYAPVSVAGVVVAGGSSATQNFLLTPVNILTPAGATIISESIPDGVLDPGETVTVSFSLKNTGGAGASTSNLTGALQVGGGLLSPGVPQNYGAVASGGPAVSMPFTFRVDPNLLCGQTLTATLALADGATSYRQVSYRFLTSSVEARYTGPPTPIPNNYARGVNIPITVSGFKGDIHDLNFKIGGTTCATDWRATTVGINHPNVYDLTIKLRSPEGTVVTLIKRDQGGANFCQTVLDDEALNRPSIQDIKWTDAPFTGTYRPVNPLSAFDGQNPNGKWILNVSDTEFPGGGAQSFVRAFSLLLSPHDCTTANYSISGQVRVGASGAAFGSVTMTLTSPEPAGFLPRVAQTDNNGNYRFTNLPAGRSYMLRASKTNYSFTPASKSYTSLGANQLDQNFTSTLKTYTISGKVTEVGESYGIDGATITLRSPAPAGFAPRVVQTASTGVYTFTNLPPGRDYTIEPTKFEYAFNPVRRSFLNLSADQPIGWATSFTGTSTAGPKTGGTRTR